MAAFRKMFFAAASAAALAAIPASAQTAFQPFNCSVTSNAPLVRWQGLTEQVGDIILTCTGGTPTASNAPVPVNNFAVTIQSTNITSQLLPQNLPQVNGGYPYSEAILTVNEPEAINPNPSGAVTPTPFNALQQPCPASNSGACTNTGDGTGGFFTYSTAGNFNMFQGYQFDAHTIRFDGIPMDAPGTNSNIVIRISNIRVDVTPFNGGSLSGQPITASLSVTGTQAVTINNIAPYVVGYAANGIKVTANGDSKGVCNPGPGRVTATVQEGFASSFKRRDAGVQNILGYTYFTETGFYEPALGWVHPELVGHASQGTRILVSLTNIENTLTITAPNTASLIGGAIAPAGQGGPAANGSGYLKLISPASFTSTADGSSTTFEYEVMYSDPSAIETADIDFAVAYPTASTYTVPPTYILASAQFSPLSTNHNAALISTDPIPRFVASPSTPQNTFFLTGCQCDLLFPYAVSKDGLETGIAISNTSADPYGTVHQSGYVQFFYYPNNTSTFVPPSSWFTTAPSSITAKTPFSQTSTGQVAAGDQLLMTVGGGDSTTGLKGAAGFNGYIIAVTGFQYCHAFAFVSDTSVQKLAEGYLAVVLDQPNVSLDNRGVGGTPVTGIAPPSAVPGEHLDH